MSRQKEFELLWGKTLGGIGSVAVIEKEVQFPVLARVLAAA
jgi:hypothetical protein